MLACRSWSIDDAEVFALFAGSSPASTASATVQQLEKRLEKADAWLRQASARRVGG